MRICIIRNAESRSNASVIRILDALLYSGNKCILLTRSRYNEQNSVIKKEYSHGDDVVENYEINIKTKTGKGLINIFQLIYYQFIVFKWIISNKDKFDVIHSFDLDSGLPVLLASKLIKKKYVYHIADFYIDSRSGIPNVLKRIVKKLEYMVIANAETTIICTEERRNQIQGSKPKKLVVIHNTPSKEINIEEIQNRYSDKDEYGESKLIFTYVGGLSEKRFIRSIIDVFRQHTEFNLELAGMGNLSNYAKQASQEYKNINFNGMINYEDALNLYSKCDIMFAIYDPTVPNHRYSAPNKVYEAMMLGKPIIVAKGTGIDKLVEEENIGIVIEYNEIEFLNALMYLRDNPQKVDEMGKNGQNAFQKYTWDIMKERIIEVYNDLI